jgi:MoxR-like ATPase
MSATALADRLRAAGYEPRRREMLAVTAALATVGAGARALLLDGPQGCGKSALAAAVAAAHEAPLVVAQFHAWTDADELFVGVDVVAAVAGDAAAVRQDGVLAVAARLAEEHDLVVVLLDEVDKGSERAEVLLLDWLQSGRVPIRPGVHLRTQLARVLVVLTSNGARPLSDALLRRVRRVRMEPLPVDVQERILHERTGMPAGVVRLAWRAARAVGGPELSLQEGERLLGELRFAESIADVRESLAGWAARDAAQNQTALRADVAALWGELLARGAR